jgi:hypothetical protein
MILSKNVDPLLETWAPSEENGTPVMLAPRLKIDNKKIAEIYIEGLTEGFGNGL